MHIADTYNLLILATDPLKVKGEKLKGASVVYNVEKSLPQIGNNQSGRSQRAADQEGEEKTSDNEGNITNLYQGYNNITFLQY